MRRGTLADFMSDDRSLNQLFSDEMGQLVESSFAGVDAEWWWERRTGGGVSVCQELDPAALVIEFAREYERDESEIRQIAVQTLGLQDFEPVVLVFDLEGDLGLQEAVENLTARSSTSEGLAANIYRSLMEALRTQGK